MSLKHRKTNSNANLAIAIFLLLVESDVYLFLQLRCSESLPFGLSHAVKIYSVEQWKSIEMSSQLHYKSDCIP
jgi:hypothetical protein